MSNISKESLLQSFPSALLGTEKLNTLADITASILAERVDEIDKLLIYTRIDTLSGDLLDILAKDFKVDWWDSTMSIEEKRNTMRSSWDVHYTLGTKYAVINAVASIYDDVEMEEWFEYDGDPFYFKINVGGNDSVADYEKLSTVMGKIKYYKNVRSRFEKITFKAKDMVVKNYIGGAIYENATFSTKTEDLDVEI